MGGEACVAEGQPQRGGCSGHDIVTSSTSRQTTAGIAASSSWWIDQWRTHLHCQLSLKATSVASAIRAAKTSTIVSDGGAPGILYLSDEYATLGLISQTALEWVRENIAAFAGDRRQLHRLQRVGWCDEHRYLTGWVPSRLAADPPADAPVAA
jgi:hypothetical protein